MKVQEVANEKKKNWFNMSKYFNYAWNKLIRSNHFGLFNDIKYKGKKITLIFYNIQYNYIILIKVCSY